MKYLIFSTILTLLSLFTIGQDCKTQAANKPATMVNSKDNIVPIQATMNAAEKAKMKPYLAKAEAWVKNIVTNFTGAKLDYFNNFFPKYLTDAETTDRIFVRAGIKGYYQSQLMFFAYYCYDNNNKIFTEEESGSSVYVNFNNVFKDGFTTDGGNTTLNGKPLFQVVKKKRTDGRIDFYELLGHDNSTGKMFIAADFIILRNSDKPVFISITRKQYLEQMPKDIEEFKKREAETIKMDYTPANEAANKARFDDELRRIDNSKSYTKEQMAPYRKRLIETWETEKQKFDRRMGKLEKESNEAKEAILDFLKKPTEWLNKNVNDFCSFTSYSGEGVTQFFDNLDRIRKDGVGDIIEETARELATINSAYFNKNLSNDVPQVIMVQLRGVGYPHMQKVAALVKQPGALAPLLALLNGTPAIGNNEPPAITSIYKLNFLPKLNKLTPLVIPADMKASPFPVTAPSNIATAKINIELPERSAKLNNILPQFSSEMLYFKYISYLNEKISTAITPAEKKKADEYLKNKKIALSKDIANTALAAWLQKTPKGSLYFYSKAMTVTPTDTITANNFAAFLIMAGMPDKAIPILEYWNKQKSNQPTILTNLGNAYYRLGDITTAVKYLQQAVQNDSLNATAHKILCIIYYKKGDAKKAAEHGEKSITASHDEQVIAILKQLNNNVKPGEIMSRFPLLPVKQFPMLERIKMPAMPSRLDDMEAFVLKLYGAYIFFN